MVDVKQMPYSEKYARVMDALEHDEYVAAFVESHLGRKAAAEYRKRCESGLLPVPEDASPEEKYELAYKNWMWTSRTAFGFVRERLGDEGMEEFIAADVAALERESFSPSLYLLRLLRAVSPGRAFEMVSKQSTYELQWLTPYVVDELDRERAVLMIPHCKLLDYPGCEDACLVGCQRIYPRWLADQLKVNMATDRQGTSCTITLTPAH